MKIAHRLSGNQLVITITGVIDNETCNCLEHFWNRHVPRGLDEIELDLGRVDDIDAHGVATLTNLLRQDLAGGARVRLIEPPQSLAHTLYKTAVLQSPDLTLLPRRTEVPYAG